MNYIIFMCSLACDRELTHSDVTIQSSDGQIFPLHKKNLAFYTEGFPCAETPTAGRTVALSESSETLGLLFQFIYPQRFPDLDEVDFGSTLLLTEAAEKYVVYAAIYACKIRLKYVLSPESAKICADLCICTFHSKFIDSRPRELLPFAVKHSYHPLIIRLAPRLIDLPLSELLEILPSSMYIPWVCGL